MDFLHYYSLYLVEQKHHTRLPGNETLEMLDLSFVLKSLTDKGNQSIWFRIKSFSSQTCSFLRVFRTRVFMLLKYSIDRETGSCKLYHFFLQSAP